MTKSENRPSAKRPSDSILILDFGSQYTQLIARRVREMNVYSEIRPYSFSLDEIKSWNPKGIILSGGPASVLSKGAPTMDSTLFDLGIPVLGICYGMQLITHLKGGKVEKADHREFGRAELNILEEEDLFWNLEKQTSLQIWASHGDRIQNLPHGFRVIAKSSNSPIAAFKDTTSPLFALQFHPEVAHTPCGKQILSNFLFRICHANPTWTMKSFIDHSIEKIRTQVGTRHVILGLSGGVDSTVTAFLLHKAIGDRVTPIFINNGLLRLNEEQKILELFQRTAQIKVNVVDASQKFLTELKNVTDPEQKRKIIGRVFIEAFEHEAQENPDAKFLAQGTLYPDVIESVSFSGGPSVTIKSHHNVGGLPKKMNLELIEPLRELFKDEVRLLGKELGIEDDFIYRQPFPGPGLAVRILGEITPERLDLLRKADSIVIDEIKKAGLYRQIWQSFAVLLPVKTVGVMGDERTYENVIAVRAVKSEDGMTADWVQLPYDLLGRISTRIINEVKGINRVVYDISSKPPSTIEWE